MVHMKMFVFFQLVIKQLHVDQDILCVCIFSGISKNDPLYSMKAEVLSRLALIPSVYYAIIYNVHLIQWSLRFKTTLFNNNLHFKTGYE